VKKNEVSEIRGLADLLLRMSIGGDDGSRRASSTVMPEPIDRRRDSRGPRGPVSMTPKPGVDRSDSLAGKTPPSSDI